MGGGLLTSAPLKPLLVGTKTVNGPKFCRGHEREPERRKGRQEEDRSTRRTLDILNIKVLLEEHRCCMKTTSEVLKLVITG